MAFDQSYFILVAEDNPDDVRILERALAKAGSPVRYEVVSNGEGVVAYLKGEGNYANRNRHPIPQLILLDLKMPGMNGFEVLTWVRQRAEWRCLPIVVLTVSHYGPDIQKAYELGANSFLSKDSNFENFCASLRQMTDFWLKHATLPRPGPFVPDPSAQSHQSTETTAANRSSQPSTSDLGRHKPSDVSRSSQGIGFRNSRQPSENTESDSTD
jgi:CheY-like chemotaxis protein